MIVGEGKCQPDYFLDRMQWWEVQRYINGIRRAERTAWTTTRQHAFWILRSLGAKIDTANDLVRFPWEEKERPAPDTSIDEEEAKRLLNLIHEENAKVNPRP